MALLATIIALMFSFCRGMGSMGDAGGSVPYAYPKALGVQAGYAARLYDRSHRPFPTLLNNLNNSEKYFISEDRQCHPESV